MISSAEIRDVTFSNSMAGYKKDEVDILLDKIEVDLEKYESIVKKQELKINELEGQVSDLKESQNSIQAVLLNAQKLADKIVADAKSESEKIISDAQNNIAEMTKKSKLIASEFDVKANEKKGKLEAELAVIIKEAENKKDLIEKASETSVKNQQELFNRLKSEMALFRSEITEKYKEHLKLLATIPTAVELDPETSAKIINENYKEVINNEEDAPLFYGGSEDDADENYTDENDTNENDIDENDVDEDNTAFTDTEDSSSSEISEPDNSKSDEEVFATKTFDVSEFNADDTPYGDE